MNTRIGALILFINGMCFQSFGWKQFKPLCNLETVIKILEEYEIDEISIIRPVRNNKDSNFEKDCQIISKISSNTPITFGGGIRKLTDLKILRKMPIERICLNSSFLLNKIDLIKKIKSDYGRQSIVCALPLKFEKNKLLIFNSEKNKFISILEYDVDLFKEYINEYMIIDIANEGNEDKFNFEILERLKINYNKLIISGGVGSNVVKTAKKYKIASVLIENRYFYKELNNFQ